MKPIIKNCQYCGYVIASLYEKQAQYNLESHERACKKNPKNMEEKKDE